MAEDDVVTPAAPDRATRKSTRIGQTRTRTGCQRCRTRRRKCDEVKPRCARCAEAGVECHYITRVSFLKRNAQTLDEGVSARSVYSAVQFVNDGDSSKVAERTTPESHPLVAHVNPAQSSNYGSSDTVAASGASGLEPLLGQVNPNQLVQPVQTPQNSSSSGVRSRATREPSHQERKVDLLKHYIHHVAPWLDVYDADRVFGVLVIRLATVSPRLLATIIKFSAASLGSPVEEAGRDDEGSLILLASRMPSGPVPPADSVLQVLASFVLSRTQIFFEAVPDTWEPMFVAGGSQPVFAAYKSTDLVHRRIWYGIVTLMSRLSIAYSLVNETAPAWCSQILREVLDESPPTPGDNDDSQGVLNASLRCLGFLADVMNLCLEPPENSTSNAASTHESRVESWQNVLAALRAWHADRPQGLQPLIELEKSGTAFPTVLFTSSAGVNANAMYHTAMHILLSHKPRTIRPRDGQDQGEAAHMSPLWHARRICGVALASEHAGCWDPCMIAAFFFAARRMTHQDQQRDLLACLQGVRAAGWRVDGLVRRLREEWGPFGLS